MLLFITRKTWFSQRRKVYFLHIIIDQQKYIYLLQSDSLEIYKILVRSFVLIVKITTKRVYCFYFSQHVFCTVFCCLQLYLSYFSINCRCQTFQGTWYKKIDKVIEKMLDTCFLIRGCLRDGWSLCQLARFQLFCILYKNIYLTISMIHVQRFVDGLT